MEGKLDVVERLNFAWLLRMAWRDSRRNRGKLLLFISSIVVGIAALVAIDSFGENLQKDINNESKTLLAADLMLNGTAPISDSIEYVLDGLGALERSESKNFLTFVSFPKTEDARLAQVKAIEGNYPFYGTVLTTPLAAAAEFGSVPKALVEATLMMQFGLTAGDSIKIGNATFEIGGALEGAPGRSAIAGAFAPVIHLPMAYLEETGLLQFGSRVFYQQYFRFDDEVDVDALAAANLVAIMDTTTYHYETVQSRKEEYGEVFGMLTTFLNLIGFIALLLGCVGVASSVHIYIKDKRSTVAVLRCLGASGKQAFFIFLLQVVAMGFIGALIGAALGSLLQIALPTILGDFLPVQNVSTDVSISAILLGVTTGLGIAVLFALLPLMKIRKISPLRALRASINDGADARDPMRWVIYGGIALFVLGFTCLQVGFYWEAIFFPIAILLALLALAGMAKVLMWAVKRFFPTGWNYVWRQSIANLYRPNNQTLILMISIGLGTALISTLFFTREMLLQQVELSSGEGRPNMILFDIQSSQLEEATALVESHDLPVLDRVPIVTMRLDELEAEKRNYYLQDTTSDVSRRALTREYRVTYRDEMIDSETLIEGEWHGDKSDDGTIYVSIESGLAEGLEAEVGTQLTFNVQGRKLQTEVSSIREVDFTQLQTNFLVVFPTGILEKAPQMHVLLTNAPTRDQAAGIQRAVAKSFGNISIIDLYQVLNTVNNILSKISFVIRFMALFSILTGLIVLISSVVLSKYQRIQESVLLRTIGASRRQILWINAIEYFMLGGMAALTGILLASIGSFFLAVYGFEVDFAPNWGIPIAVLFGIGLLTVVIGLLNSREILVRPPLEVLRKEV